MKSIYYAIKIKVNSWMDWVIRLCNRERVKAVKNHHAWARKSILNFYQFVGDAALLVQQFPRVEAQRYRHSLGNFIFVGMDEKECLSFFRHLDPDLPEIQLEPIGKYQLWALPKQVDEWLANDTDIVLCDLSRLYPFSLHTRFNVTTPIAIQQVVYLPENIEQYLEGSKFRELRRIINRAERTEIVWRFSTNKADFDYFYQELYLPYTQERHGIFAVVNSYDLLWKEFIKGGLIMIYKGEEIIAGSLVQATRHYGIGQVGGVRDTSPDLVPKKIYGLLVWYSIEWAFKQGVRRFDLGNSYALRSNGVYRFKKNFGSMVESQYGFIFPYRKILMNNPPEALTECLNNAGLICEKNGKHFGVILNTGESEKLQVDYGEALEKAVNEGLAGIVIVHDHRKKYMVA
ncbi:MAG: GNAT family N-acetyltransferase [Chloroflexi bacterium]|nr:GNAT family N-acetyltransferase [Chloroflexota bacterium]